MALTFTPGTGNEKKKRSSHEIPDEILNAVRVMGDYHTTENAQEEELVNLSPTQASSEKEEKAKSSPFLSNADWHPTDQEESFEKPDGFPSKSVPLSSGLTPPILGKFEMEKPQKRHWIIMTSVSVLLLAILLGGGWYYSTKYRVTNDPELPSEDVVVVTSPVINGELKIENPYALDAPNYLPIDTETASLQDIKKALDEAGTRILGAKVASPVEFVITDKNNNPLAFSRLAFLVDMGLNEDLLSSLDENFLIFLYNDVGKIHTGLLVDLLEAEEARRLIAKEEKNLPAAFQKLFYPGINLPRGVTFRSGSYNSQAIRFVNVDTVANLSFDYAVREDAWIIGTSKDTLRTLLDNN